MVVVLWMLACGDDRGGDGAGATADSGSVPVADASGVGDAGRSDGGGVDGGRGDASPAGDPDGAAVDASPPDAAVPGLVTVTVEWAPYPVDQATVFFLRSDDSVIDVVSTDADGRAQAMYEEPGTVVIHFGVGGVPPTQQALLAYLRVAPGTDIYSGAPIADRGGAVTVSGPEAEGAVGYMVETACGIGAALTPPVRAALANCRPRTHVIWVVRAMVEGQLRLASAFLPSTPVEQDGVDTVYGPLRPDLIQTTRVTGLPEVEYAEMAYRIYGPHGTVQDGPMHEYLTPDDGSLDVADAFHDLRGNGLVGRVLASIMRPGGDSTIFAAWLEHDGNPDVDLAAVSPASLQGSVFDRASATWTWTEGSPGFVTGVRGRVLVAEEGRQPYFWQVLAPDDGRPLRVPRLPAPFERFDVSAESAVTAASVELFGHTRGYAALLANLDIVLDQGGQPGDVATFTYDAGSVIE